MSESLESLSSTANSLKTNIDKKSCQIINKTTAIYDTVKSQTENIKTIAEKSKKIYNQEVKNDAAKINSVPPVATRSSPVPDPINRQRSKTTT